MILHRRHRGRSKCPVHPPSETKPAFIKHHGNAHFFLALQTSRFFCHPAYKTARAARATAPAKTGAAVTAGAKAAGLDERAPPAAEDAAAPAADEAEATRDEAEPAAPVTEAEAAEPADSATEEALAARDEASAATLVVMTLPSLFVYVKRPPATPPAPEPPTVVVCSAPSEE